MHCKVVTIVVSVSSMQVQGSLHLKLATARKLVLLRYLLFAVTSFKRSSVVKTESLVRRG